jgi:hypothetical protein
MNCEEVQKYLSDFLDESLEFERSQKLSDHLAACSLCSEEMASLAECQRLVSGLPAVEPPVGFTNRVMAKVREAANSSSLWERLFSSLRINIPLQATAVVLIAVLAAYIYQKEPLQRESGVTFPPESSLEDQEETDKLAPSAKRAPSVGSTTKQLGEETKARVQEFKDSTQLKNPQSSSKPEEQRQPAEGNQLVAPGAAGSQEEIRSPATLSPDPLQEKFPAASEAASARLEQSSRSGEARPEAFTPPAPQSEKESASNDAAFARKSSEPVEGSAVSALDPRGSGTVTGVALPADHELAIRLRELVRDDKNTADRLAWERTQAERRLSTLKEEARNLEQAREQVVQTGRAQTVWVTIARNHYERFKKELAELGGIEVESSAPEIKNDAIAKSSDRLRIKVTILPPPSSGNPVPSAPSSR